MDCAVLVIDKQQNCFSLGDPITVKKEAVAFTVLQKQKHTVSFLGNP